jgi:hypothetical protein
MGIFGDIFSTKPAEDAAKAKISGINSGLSSANGTLNAGQAGADALYGQAQQPFTNLIDSTGRGSAAYGDATGANGADGLARAKSLFTATPGYQSGIDMTLDQNDRRAASRGILASGNTIADTAKLATDYSNQHYGSYVGALAPYLGANSSAISGNAGVLGSRASADLGVAGTKANLGYTAQTGIGNANADAETAKYSASQNFWGALMGGAKLAVGAATGMPTGGGSPGMSIPGSYGATSYGGANGPTPVSGGWFS